MSNSRKRKHSRRRKSNPHMTHKRRHRRNPFHVKRRRNSRHSSMGGKITIGSVMKVGAGAAVGSVVARGAVQQLLQANNVGLVGYGANAAMSVLGAWLIHKFTGAKDIALGFVAGGLGATMVRIYEEKISQTSASPVSGLGDIAFSDTGLGLYNTGLTPGAYPEYGRFLPPASVPINAGAGAGAASQFAAATTRYKSRFSS